MKLRNKLIISSVIMTIGGIIACIAGIKAENHPIGDMPALVSILGAAGLMMFFCGLICIAFIILFGDEE